MTTRTPTRVPHEFCDFSAIYSDENYDLSLSHEDALRRTVALLQYGDRVKIIRDFIDRMLIELEEDLLRRLWMSTSPQVAFGGEGEPYREFFALARDVMSEALENDKLPN